MNRHDNKNPAAASGDLPVRAGAAPAANAIVRANGAQALSARHLEERRLIHRNDSARAQADAFRQLRTSLLALSGASNFITLVAPISPGCGGSFVARNLAAAFAFDETKSVLLIDCDARHPSQAGALGIDVASHGLMDYLDDPGADIAGIIHATGIARLHLVPSGRTREASGESFTSFRMRTLLDSLRSGQQGNHLILDAPSVQGAPDARILSDLADHVVLVAGYGRVTAEQVEAAAATFAPEKLAGVVFNNTP